MEAGDCKKLSPEAAISMGPATAMSKCGARRQAVKPEEFDALNVGDILYRYDEGIRKYTITNKTLCSCEIDRPCIISAARAKPGAGKKMIKKTVEDHFWTSARDAIGAEQKRIMDVIDYHKREKRIAVETLVTLTKTEAAL